MNISTLVTRRLANRNNKLKRVQIVTIPRIRFAMGAIQHHRSQMYCQIHENHYARIIARQIPY